MILGWDSEFFGCGLLFLKFVFIFILKFLFIFCEEGGIGLDFIFLMEVFFLIKSLVYFKIFVKGKEDNIDV